MAARTLEWRLPLYPGEHRGLKAPGELLRARQDEPAPGSAQGLGRGAGDDVGMRQGRGVRAGGDEPCDMGHVDQQSGFDGFGDACHAFEVDRARIGGAAGDQQHRAHLAGPGLDPVVVEQAARAVHTVVMGVEPAPRKVRPGTVAEMTAGREVEAEDPVPGTQEHKEHRLVRLRARMRLDVGIGGAEEFLRALDGEAFDDVDVLSAPVEAVSGIALQRLVADLMPERLAHRAAHDVLRGDELDLGALAARLVVERLAHRGIGLGEGTRDVGGGVVAVVQGASHPIPFGARGGNSARPGRRPGLAAGALRRHAADNLARRFAQKSGLGVKSFVISVALSCIVGQIPAPDAPCAAIVGTGASRRGPNAGL